MEQAREAGHDEWRIVGVAEPLHRRIRWDVRKHAAALRGHGGGDHRLARDLVQAVSRRDPTLLTSSLEASMESHLIGFKAEESRTRGGVLVKIDPGAV